MHEGDSTRQAKEASLKRCKREKALGQAKVASQKTCKREKALGQAKEASL